VELTQVAPDVYACLQPDRGLGWSNAGLVDRGRGLVIDTFWDLPRTRAAMALYAEVRADVPGQLVNTHHNGDHCWGNQLFAEAGTEIIGHRLCAARMGSDVSPAMLTALADDPDPPDDWMFLVEALRDTFDFTGVELTPPTTLLDDELVLDLDGLEARVVYVGPAHTAGDVIVHLPEHGVVFTGDILFHECTPIGWEGTNARWVAALEHIAALEPAVVVPGHGPLATTDGVLALRDYLVFVHEEATRHYEAGRTSLEAALAIDLGPYAGWTEPERLAMNVERSYRERRGGAWDESVDLTKVAPNVTALRKAYRGNRPID
jgi:glyoxylase-like metal-dependent hydrolase (beta-lactamase superfamily II)